MSSEFRQNPATREWVLFAPERARRPASSLARERSQAPAHDASCPFCPGREECTPDESLRLNGPDGDWAVRAFPNRYPAVSPRAVVEREGDVLGRHMPAMGRHEIFAESRRHDASLGTMDPAEVELVVQAWHRRMVALRAEPGVDHVSLFKNHGRGAGMSIAHPHSQIVTLPLVPWQVRHRLTEAARYYDDNGRCVWCDVLFSERESGQRLVAERSSFTAFVPYAAYRPSTVWIVPHRHAGCFSQAAPQDLPELASILREVLYRLDRALDDPPFNLVFRVGSRAHLGAEHCHWYIAIVPRLSHMSGFELGTGMYINSSWPEQDARALTEVRLQNP